LLSSFSSSLLFTFSSFGEAVVIFVSLPSFGILETLIFSLDFSFFSFFSLGDLGEELFNFFSLSALGILSSLSL